MPVPAPAPTPAPFVPPSRDPAPVNQPVPTEPPVTDFTPAPTPVAPMPVPAVGLPADIPPDLLDYFGGKDPVGGPAPKPMTESEQISRYGKPQRYFGNQILKPGYYAGPADRIYKYSEGPFAEQTQAYLDSVGMTLEQCTNRSDWEAYDGTFDRRKRSLGYPDKQPA